MTDWLNSLKNLNRNLLLIAGLNNNDEAMKSLGNELASRGYRCHYLNLPGQGQDRSESEDFDRAANVFADSIGPLIKDPYSIVAFSTGALYFNLWLKENPTHAPLVQVLLSPAFRIKKKSFLGKLFSTLPAHFLIKSLAPSKFRRFSWMRVSEYRQLFKLIDKFDESAPISTAFKIYVDSRDELVDAKALKEIWGDKTHFQKRRIPKFVPGVFHALFHPDFWHPEDWNKFVDDIDHFLRQKKKLKPLIGRR